jgi:ATP-binding cassette subfamily B protein
VSLPGRRILAPEVVQSSAMDCGPAALKCLLEGFGIRASYGRLREACQTDLDGTSIDTLEEVAGQLGLDAEQVLVPADHLLREDTDLLPAVVVVRLPSGVTHFVVAWRRHGPVVQLMDPATGRRWASPRELARQLYVHEMAVPAADWLAWATSDAFLGPLRARLGALGVARATTERLVAAALSGRNWRPLAALDAAARLAGSLVRSGALGRGAPAGRLVERLAARGEAAIPACYRSAETAPPGPDGTERLLVRGAVAVHARRVARARAAATLPPDLAAAIAEPPARPLRELLRLLRADGALAPAAVAAGLALAASGVLVEALLLRARNSEFGCRTSRGYRRAPTSDRRRAQPLRSLAPGAVDPTVERHKLGVEVARQPDVRGVVHGEIERGRHVDGIGDGHLDFVQVQLVEQAERLLELGAQTPIPAQLLPRDVADLVAKQRRGGQGILAQS